VPGASVDSCLEAEPYVLPRLDQTLGYINSQALLPALLRGFLLAQRLEFE